MFQLAKMNLPERKIIVAVTGASGSVYAMKLLEQLCGLKEAPKEIAVIFSDNAKGIWRYETGREPAVNPPAKEYSNNSFEAPFASGSSLFDTMIICPASMGITGRIASGISDDLITRAADVMLKEKRKLIIVPRESPYNLIHIRNMETLALAGAVIAPANPSFYSHPQSIDDLIQSVTGRIISLAGFDIDIFRWKDEN